MHSPDYKKQVAANSLYSLGLEYHLADRDEEAIRYYEQSVALRPDDSGTQNNLGIVLARRGRFLEAIVHFEEALPGFPDAYYNLGRALTLLGRHQEAEARFEQARILSNRPSSDR